MEHQPASGRGCVDGLVQDDEVNAACGELLHDFEEVGQFAADPVEPHSHEHVALAQMIGAAVPSAARLAYTPLTP